MTSTDLHSSTSAHADPGAAPIRRLLLALVFIGSAGLIAELLLLEHTESAFQWLPLGVLGLIVGFTVVLGLRPSPRLLRLFRWLMVVTILVGVLGVYLHYDGNREFELEMDPEAGGLALLWSVLHGATPTLAPGAMVQLGLLGLIFGYKHPLLRPRA